MSNRPIGHPVEEPGRAWEANFLPPWLWLWLLLYVTGFFHSYTYLANDISSIFAASKNTTPDDIIIRLLSIAEFVPLLAIFAGVLSVFFPWVRARWLKLRYRIMHVQEFAQAKNIPKGLRDEVTPKLLVIQTFIHSYAPEVSLTYALGFPDDSLDDRYVHQQPLAQWLPFALQKCRLWLTNRMIRRLDLKDKAITYSAAYRRTTITVSSAQLALWDNDPSQAREVLLHELAHHYHGDAPLVGSGSLLETVGRSWLWLSLLCTILPFGIYNTVNYVASSQDFGLIGKILPDVLQRLFLHSISLDLSNLLMILLLSLVWNATQFSMLIAAMWCAEFNADRFMRDNAGSIKMLEVAARGKKGLGMQKTRLRDRIFANITHPPKKLRRWMVQRDTFLRSDLLLLLFPLAFFVYLLLFVAQQAVSQLLPFVTTGESIQNILLQSGVGVLFSLRAIVPIFLCIAVLFLLWPRCAPGWQRIFHPDNLQTRARRVFPRYHPHYYLCALLVVLFCTPGIGLLMLPDATLNAIMQYHLPQPSPTPTSTNPTDTLPILVLHQLYNGALTDASNKHSIPLSLSKIQQDQQGNIHGTLVLGASFSEQGSFVGTITTNRVIQITFTPTNKAQAPPIQFFGTINAAGTLLRGLYIIANAGQSGTWQAK